MGDSSRAVRWSSSEFAWGTLRLDFKILSIEQIVAVILVDTGIALLAYMDGISESKTLASVVLAALSGAGYAVFRVMFRKMMGDPPPGKIRILCF